MQTKTNELTGAALDWAVAKCEGFDYFNHQNLARIITAAHPWNPSTNWSQGGPIIEREQLNIACFGDVWEAWPNTGMSYCKGPNPLVAAMRCYCCAKLGDEIDIPEELCQQQSS